MRICVIASIFPPYARGGAETVAEASALAFAQAGHEVCVITCAPFEGWGSFAGKWETDNCHPDPEPREGEEPARPPALEGHRPGGSLPKGARAIREPRDSSASGLRMTEQIRVFRFTPLNLFTIFSISKRPALLRFFWHLIDMVNPHTYLVVRKILLKEKPDLILTHNLKGLGDSVHLAIHHSRYIKQFVRQHTKWFHTIHDMGALHPTGLCIWGREKSIFQRNPLVWLYARLNKKLLGDPDVVIAPSQFLLDEYRKRGFFPKSRTAVIRNPVVHNSSPQFNRNVGPGLAAPCTELRSGTVVPGRLPAGSSRDGGAQGPALQLALRFLYLGQLEPYKGLRLLLDVWRDFSAAHKDAELMIAGQGSMQVQVEQAVKSLARVRYIGFVEHEKLWELFGVPPPSGGAPPLGGGRCILVLPSLAYENSPTTIGESFSCGVPVVASRIGGIPELVKDGINGILFEPGNVDALRQAMGEAMKTWSVLHDGTRKSAAEFGMEKYKERIEYLIHLISNSPNEIQKTQSQNIVTF